MGERAVGGAEVAEALGAEYRPGRLAGARTAAAASDTLRDFQVPMLVGTCSAIAHGFLAGPGGPGDLAALLGRPPRPALEVIAGR
ncbi:hypothetical protein BG452_22225 [Streptomyces sp. CBMA123]|nr:hypothetical protein [Streptomyces sp. CBMA123]